MTTTVATPWSLRHPVVGGIAAWQLPVVTTTLGLGGLGLGLPELAVAASALGFVACTLLCSVVVEVSGLGLTRGFILKGRFLGRTTVMAWRAVESVHTDWRCPGDDTALRTTVRDRQGSVIHFTTAMGLRAYWSCLEAVVARAPAARRSGLTDVLLSQAPPSSRNLVAGAATVGALAMVIVAFAGLHCLWAQGRSSLARDLEQIGEAPTRSPAPRVPGDSAVR